ncbi:ATP-dependent nuclease [Micromonospora chalcea]|uniref:ATP-dependent nuclease n=1 Tax=Micromonospora chalcea TaxID=1874 RepID=UPI0037B2CA3E
MIDIEISVRNYRCFGDEPATLEIRDGFTAIIGTNNSGKSSLLRLPYEIRQLIQMFTEFDGSRFSRAYRILAGEEGGTLWQPMVSRGERIQRAGAERPMEIIFKINDGPNGPFLLGGTPVELVSTYTFQSYDTKAWLQYAGTRERINIEREYNSLNINSLKEAMRFLTNSMYVGPFRNAINIGGQEKYYDIQTGDAFVKRFAELKGGYNPAANEEVSRLLDEVRRIFGFSQLDVNASPDTESLQVTIDGRSFRLNEQGAGLAHFIVVLVNVLVGRPSILLIDEPELNLHASLQLDFLSTLAKFTEGSVLFATHSMGLARTAADRIYTVSSKSDGTRRIREYESDRDLATLAGQLSFDKRAGIGYTRILLVEGKSEIRALMQLLRLYGKEHEVLMLPLHGDEMIRGDVEQELLEVTRLSDSVSYLIDSERTSRGEPLSKSRQGFVDLCDRLGIEGLVLERRALENYLPEHAVVSAFGEQAKPLGPFEKKGSAQGWPKTNNWRAASRMRSDDLVGTDLGQFLARL